MRRSRSPVAALFLAVLLAPVHSLGAELSLSVVGQAYQQSTRDLLYTEYHYCSRDGLTCSVKYRGADGDLLALKQLDYSASPLAPSLVMNNYAAELTRVVEPVERNDLVVDAGFDNFVRSEWDALSRGSVVRFPFRVISLDNPLTMRAQRLDRQDCPAEQLCVEVKIDSWLIGMLVDPIELNYSRPDRQLLRYKGLSNLRGADGETPLVTILYQYQPDQNQLDHPGL